MADISAEDTAYLEELVRTLQRRLRVLETQAAGYGALAVPPHIVLEVEDTRHKLTQASADLRRLRPGPVADRSPYLGLLTFQEANADLFFGRDMLIANLAERVQHAPFLAVLGASGSGKSSVVRAGLLPLLKGGALPGSETWRFITLKPGARPLDMLATELAKLQNGDLSLVLTLSHQLAESDRALLLAVDLLLDRAAGQRLVLVVDQFEELWTLAPADGEPRAAFLAQQQRPFIRLLLTALAAPDTPLLIILTMRADFLHRAADDPALAHAISEHDLIVSPMAADELRDAITRPAELAGGDFEPGLVDELIAQATGRQGALPLLEYTLAEIWKQREPQGTMTWDTYKRLGGIEGALAVRADAILAEHYTAAQQDDLRQVLLRLVQPGDGVADTRRRVRFDELVPAGESPEALYALLKPLIDERLLTSGGESASDEETIEVSHEALIRVWPTLGRWIGEARADLRIQLQLEEAAQEWFTSDQNADLLWRGLRLSNAAAWLERARPRLNARDQGFLDASRAAEQGRADAEEASRLRELAQAQALAAEQQRRVEEQVVASQRLRRQAIFLAGALVLALVAAIGAGWFGVAAQRSAEAEQTQRATAVAASQQAERLAEIALARQLAAQASHDVRAHTDRALLLGVEATQFTDEAQARGTVLSVLAANEELVGFMYGHTEAVKSVAFSPDGRTLASASDDGTVQLWDVASRQPLGEPLVGHAEQVVFSPDGRTLASAGIDGTIRLWDVASRQPLGEPLKDDTTSPVMSVAFSPDGTTLASASSDGIRLWEVASGRLLGEPLTDSTGIGNSVAFSPDGAMLALVSDDGTVRLWDMASRQPQGEPLEGDTAFVTSMVFSPNGAMLASASFDGTVHLWDVASRQRQGELLEGHSDSIKSMAFSPDGMTLVSTSDDGTVRFWDVASNQPQSESLTSHSDDVNSVAFSPDGMMLALASDDGTVHLWDVASRQPLGELFQDDLNGVRSVAFSSDGTILASASRDSTIQLWDVTNRQALGDSLKGHSDDVNSVAFSPDGTTLASASDDGTVLLWDVARRQARGEPLISHIKSVTSVVFSPDGRMLAFASHDGRIWLWDVVGGRALGDPLQDGIDIVSSVAFSPDGQILASATTSGSIQLWDVASHKLLSDLLKGHADPVTSVVFSPDGRRLASASADNTIRLWDVASRQPLGDPLTGHTNIVWRVVFSPDGKTLASASEDRSIRLWDVVTRQPLGDQLQGHTGAVTSVAFSPDGQMLASASEDGTIRLWPMNVEVWIAHACRIVGRNLSQNEWDQFVSPDRPYHRTCAEFPPGTGAPANAP